MFVFNRNQVCSGKRRRRWLVSGAAAGWAPAPGWGDAPCCASSPAPCPPPGAWGRAGLLATLGSRASLPLRDGVEGTGQSPAERGPCPGVSAGRGSIAAGVLPAAAPGPLGRYLDVAAGRHAAAPRAALARDPLHALGLGSVRWAHAAASDGAVWPRVHRYVNLMVLRCFLVVHDAQKFLSEGVKGLTRLTLAEGTVILSLSKSGLF